MKWPEPPRTTTAVACDVSNCMPQARVFTMPLIGLRTRSVRFITSLLRGTIAIPASPPL